MTHADLVFTGGPVFTADTVRSRARAVAVAGGRIVAVSPGDLDDLIGPSTEVVDLRGRMLVPGFQDAHVHPVWGGLDMLRCDLSEQATAAQYLDTIGAFAAAHPDDAWVLGGGWQMSAFPGGTPTAAALDTVVPDRPAFFPNRDGHGAWVNSAALRLAGIDRDTPDPADGRIERGPDGTPSGTLHEGAMSLVNRHLPEEPLSRLTEALLVGQRYLHSFGITAWQDAIVGPYGDAGDPGPAYLAAAEAGTLTARVVGAIWWDRTKGLEQIPSLIERRARYRGGRFAATSIKIMQDGVAENFTAAMLEPYGDGHGHPTDNSGISFVAPDVLNEAVPLLDAAGFQVHFHAIGDRAVRECLDAVENAIARNGRSDNRHHIAHIQVVHPEDIPRFRDLGVAANMQSYWATLEPQMVDLTLPFLGDPRSAWQYPFGDLLRSGAVLAAGSDWSVSTPDPLAAIHTAVNRTAAPGHEEGDYDPFLPEQAIDLATSLTAYTAGSAWVNHLDHVTGTIEAGKFADLAVLDRDPFAGPADRIGATRVLQTFVEGERVFAAGDA
ncbi:putative amidohydrolase YtcJ [Microbacterium terrae]|uniref:N-substituted formamide deformylase n=1 Tax=Microbacterium terrae TaxID=69369 RepID=A0A0M2GZJ7_9MICO|nr:amidohydrolase [Microbacterium terrae]KJL39333.1 N-substituted formamide deformylase precursor [Microbacterium terrae]MBP1078379.1 putative amidohydrolase YtcJ [Microbacterium terrae]GLJ97859.1 amidohydrolase [Microbacterium terrae]